MTALTCTRCGRKRRAEDFAVHRRASTGRESFCRDCKAQRQREYRATARGRELTRAAARRYHSRKHAADRGEGQPGAPGNQWHG